MKKKILSLLVLLTATVSGAWALSTTHVVTQSTLYDVFNDDGTLKDAVSAGDVLDFQGAFSLTHSLIINKQVQIIGSDGTEVNLNTESTEYQYQGLPERSFIINQDGAGTTVEDISFEDTRIWLYNTSNVTFTNVSMSAKDKIIGQGTGFVAIRYSNNVVFDGCTVYARNIGGNSLCVLTGSSNCTIKNSRFEGEGNIASPLYVGNPYNDGDKPDNFTVVSNDNTVKNCTIIVPVNSSAKFMVKGNRNIVENCTVDVNGDNWETSATALSDGNIIRNNTFKRNLTVPNYSTVENNTVTGTLSVNKGSTATGNNVKGNVSIKVNSSDYVGSTIIGNNIAGKVTFNNYSKNNTFTGNTVISTDEYAVYLNSTDDDANNLVQNNALKANLYVGDDAVYCQNATANTVSDNTAPTYDYELSVAQSEHGTVKFFINNYEVKGAYKAYEGREVTMTVTPEEGWMVDVDNVTADLFAKWESASAPRRSADEMEILTSVPLEYKGSDANSVATFTFTMPASSVKAMAAYKKLLTYADITITDIADQTYTGSNITPSVTVKDGNTELEQGTDYTLSYSNNKNAALATAQNAPTVTITGMGNYSGTVTKTFTINKKAGSISYTTTALTKAFGDAAFTNTLTKAPATGTGLGTVTYAITAETKDADCPSEHVATIDASTGRVTITGTGTATITATVADGDNYTYATKTAEYTLKVAKATISASAYDSYYTYDGYSHSITVSVTKPTSGYTIQYSTNNSTWSSSKPGRTSGGTSTIYYKVTAPNYSAKTGSATVTITAATGSIAFDQTEVTKTWGDPNFTKTYSSKTGNGTITYSSDNTTVATVTNSGEVTIKAAGTAHITVNMTQTTNYTKASASYTLTVDPADLSAAAVMLNPTQTTFEYDGAAKEPAVMYVILGDNKILAAGTDYTVSYRNNVNAATFDSENAPAAVVTGIGNYTGEASQVFTIAPVTTTVGNVTIVDGGNTNRELTVLDMGNQQGSTLPEDLVVTTLNYYRTLNVDDFAYTVCLPYAPPTENLTYYTLTDVNDGTLHFDEIDGDPQANTPYLVIAGQTTPISKENVSNVTMSKTVANEASAGGYVLKGTLSGIKHDDALGLYILQPGNRWGVIVADKKAAYVPPFRAYIEATTTDAREMLESSFDGNVTGLQNIRTTAKDGTERWYDLNGRRIEKPATKGVYIQNGKKVFIK